MHRASPCSPSPCKFQGLGCLPYRPTWAAQQEFGWLAMVFTLPVLALLLGSSFHVSRKRPQISQFEVCHVPRKPLATIDLPLDHADGLRLWH